MREGKVNEQEDDFELLARFNGGSDEAFTRIVEKHSGPLINFLHRYTRNQAASEDLAQEAFLRLYKASRDIKPGAARLSTIIYKIACNLAIDQARKERSRSGKAPTRSLDAGGEGGRHREPAGRTGTEPDALYEQAQRDKEVAGALAELPETQQLALILKVYENRPYAEIAEIMELSLSSVESLLFRARQGLSQKVK